jgi:hypothetical protein
MDEPILSRKRPRSASFVDPPSPPSSSRIVVVEACNEEEIETVTAALEPCNVASSPIDDIANESLYIRQHPRVFGCQMLSSLQHNGSNTMPQPTTTILMETILRQQPPQVRSVSDDELVRYTMAAVGAIRNNNVGKLRELLHQHPPPAKNHESSLSWLDGRNRNGESLLHLACRRSTVEVVHFLLHEAKVSPGVTDLHGRTCFHDICWRPRVDEALPIFTLMYNHFLAQQQENDSKTRDSGNAVALASLWPFHPDTRGHCCFDYCRQEHWKEWNSYLHGHWLPSSAPSSETD